VTATTSSDMDLGRDVFARLVAVLLLVTPITLHTPEQIAHRTARWKPRHGHHKPTRR
jgi:hypothetical protein